MIAPPDLDKTGCFPALPQEPVKYPCLVVLGSPEADEHGLQFILLAQQVSVGRNAECAINLKDHTISRRHVSLSVTTGANGPQVTVSNLSSQPGATRIGNETLGPNVPAKLRLEDKLQLGQTSLRYFLFDHEPQLSKHIESVTRLMQEAQYEKALGGLTALKKHRLVGGSRTTRLERLLLSARYYEARIHSILGKWSTAIDMFEEFVGADNPVQELRVKASYQLGVLYVHQNGLTQAQRLADEAWKSAESMDGYFQALILCLQGMTSARRRDLPLAQKQFQEAVERLKKSTRPTTNLSSRILFELGVACFLAERHELALSHFERLEPDNLRSTTQKVIYAEALRYRGVIHSVRRDFEQADALLRDALRIFQETKWKVLECKTQKSRALNYLSWGRLEEAVVHLQLCQKLLSGDVENEYERAAVAAHLGKVYLNRGDAQEALRWFELEKNLQEGVAGVAHSQAYTHRNFARAHRNLGHVEEATRYYERAVQAFEEFSNPVQQGITLLDLCRHRIESGQVEAATADLATAEQCFLLSNRSTFFGPTLDVLRAQIAWAEGNSERALELFSSSIHALEEAPPSYFLGETYLSHGRLCAELYRRAQQAQDTAAASEHFQEAKLLFDKGIKCATNQSLGYLLEQFRKEIEGLDHKEFIKLILSRFVNPEPLDRIINNSFHELNRFQVEERTVIFVDLSGYTALVEKEELTEVRDILNEFYGFATRIIQQYKGVVDKFIGDCVMAIFKGPTTSLRLQNQAVAAVSAALAIIEEVEHLSERRFSSTQRKLTASAGACTGKLLVGLVGSLQQMNYTCIGDVVNVAARLQGLAKPGEMLISHETYQACMQGGIVPWAHGDIREAHVKNREQPVRYWSLDKETRRLVPPISR